MNICPAVSINDILRFSSRLSTRKLLNAIRVLGSFYLSRILGRPIQSGMPFTISVEPTTSCNLGCPECPSGLRAFSRPTGKLDPLLYQKLLNESAPDLLYLYFYFQGEPYLHPGFTELVRQAHEKNIYTVTSTNGHYLNERRAEETVRSGLDRIIISIDGSTQEVYEQYRRGGELAKVIEGTKNLLSARRRLGAKNPHIILQFLVVKPNEHQVPEIFRLGKELGVDEVKLKTAQVYDYENGNPLIPDNPAYTRYRKKQNGKYTLRGGQPDHCWKMWHSCVMTWDGKIVPCCFDKDAAHRLGDMQHKSLREIWKSESYRAFRQNLLKGRKNIDICSNCSEGTKVWI
jgi:radical SAM protein with 4Fe4S-binding SPASM domain